MITEFLLNIIFALVSGMFELLPDISWNVSSSVFSYFLNVVSIAGYLFPYQTVVAITSLIVDFTIVRIILSIPKAIWDLFPLV